MTEREKVIKGLECCIGYGIEDTPGCEDCPYNDMGDTCERIRPLYEDALALLKAEEPITGETSDGYHTFNELYHHRAVLFSVIVANYKDRAWKSVRHHDGTMYDGMFIVGIDTPDGQATYHYDIDPYWDMFDCKVREFAPEWDGHTPAQAIERIGKLKAQEPRALTLEEVEQHNNQDGCVWFEQPTYNAVAAFVRKDDEDYTEIISPYLLGEPINHGYMANRFYGKAWRCWTSRPSKEEMESTPWNAQK